MPQQELALLEVPTVFAEKVGTGAVEVRGPKSLISVTWAHFSTTDQTDRSPWAVSPILLDFEAGRSSGPLVSPAASVHWLMLVFAPVRDGHGPQQPSGPHQVDVRRRHAGEPHLPQQMGHIVEQDLGSFDHGVTGGAEGHQQMTPVMDSLETSRGTNRAFRSEIPKGVPSRRSIAGKMWPAAVKQAQHTIALNN